MVDYKKNNTISLMVTKLCHDLAGPLGGLANGLDYLEESLSDNTGGDMLAQSVDLLKLSAGEATARLKFFRQAYGVVGDRALEAEQARQIVEDLIAQTKIKLIWQSVPAALPAPHYQMLLQACGLMTTVLIYGGDMEVIADNRGIHIIGRHSKYHLEPSVEQAIAGSILAEEPRTIQAALCAALVEEEGWKLAVIKNNQSIELKLHG